MLIPLTLLVPVNSYLALYLQIYVNIFQTFGQCCVPWLSGEKGCLSIVSVDVSLQALQFPVDPLWGWLNLYWIPNATQQGGFNMQENLSDSSAGGVVKVNSNGFV